jgi:hypothetical protein
MKARVIFDLVEWECYCQTFVVPKANHVPSVPPSFPVLAISNTTFDGLAHHSFIEVNELKRLLGLS